MSQELRTTMRDSPRQSGGAGHPLPGEAEATVLGDWLHIEADGTVVVYTGKAEVGQDIRTSLAQAVAEELCVGIDAVRLVMADTERTPYDAGTFGSRTTPFMAPQLRKVAAATRDLLVDLAAAEWNVDRADLAIAEGKVRHPLSGRALGFRELTEGRRLTQPYADDVPVTPATRWSLAGTPIPKVDGRSVVTGARQYTPDLARPNMLWGMVLRSPAFGATLTSVDTQAAEALPEVTVVREGDFIAVTAPSRHRAMEAIAAIKAEWTAPDPISSHDLFEYFRDNVVPPEDTERYARAETYEVGSLEAGRAAGNHGITRSYTVAYIAHAPMEPRAALAEWSDNRLTVRTGTQRPFGVRTELAAAFGIPEEDIRVIVPATGGAFGGKHTGEAAIEAARLARATGRPVKIIWTREEEFGSAYLRPAGVIDIEATANAEGMLTAWEFHNYNSGSAGMRTPYEVPNQRIAYHPTLAPLRQGSYRALAATANHFARETHMDELAHALGIDPLAFRLRNLRDARLRAVLEAAAARFRWGEAAPAAGQGFGIAGGTEKGSYVATCAEVAVDRGSGEVRVVRVVQAFECGAIVNPDGLRNQVEGAIVQGLGGALFEAIDFVDGTVLSNRFSSYRVPRFADIPAIEVVLLDRKDLPSAGAGETPIVTIAPAIGNAIFAATGTRLRSLPLVPDGLPPASPLAEGR